MAIGFVERRCRLLSSELLTSRQEIIIAGTSNELDLVADDVYYYVVDSRQQNDFSRASWYLKLQKTNPLIKDLTV